MAGSFDDDHFALFDSLMKFFTIAEGSKLVAASPDDERWVCNLMEPVIQELPCQAAEDGVGGRPIQISNACVFQKPWERTNVASGATPEGFEVCS